MVAWITMWSSYPNPNLTKASHGVLSSSTKRARRSVPASERWTMRTRVPPTLPPAAPAPPRIRPGVSALSDSFGSR